MQIETVGGMIRAMFDRPYEIVSGVVTDAEMDKGALEFCIDGKSISIDGPGLGTRSPFEDGAEIDIVVRRGLILRSEFTGFAFRIKGSSDVHAAGRWRSVVLFVPGGLAMLAFAIGWTFYGWRFNLPNDLKAIGAGLGLMLWGGYELLQIAHATKMLRTKVALGGVIRANRRAVARCATD